MKNRIQTFLIISLFSVSAFAQISGSTTVCAGYTYSYTVSILNASTFTWTLPIGWYDVTGQGTSQIIGTCNVHDGVITVEGFNPNGISVGVETINVQFSAGSGWNVSPSSATGCAGQTQVSVSIQANGTGGGPGCPGGCGTGNQHANINYALYDNVWPVGNYLGSMPGFFIMPTGNTTYYIYKVDHTTGFVPGVEAILLDGGCGNATVNNAITVTPQLPVNIFYIQWPSPACIGDTILVTAADLSTFLWTNQFTYGVTLYNGNSNPASFIVDSLDAMIGVTGLDINGCLNGAIFPVETDSCITTGFHEQSITQNISITPNPSTDNVLIKTNYNTAVPLQIINPLGQIVFENKNVVQQINISVKNFANGVYTVKAGNAVQRFLKN